MLKKIKTYYQTIKYLKWIQIKYRIWYYFFKPSLDSIIIKDTITTVHLNMSPSIPSYSTYLGNKHFSFLNLKTHFKEKIDWNYNKHGKLWTYNLNYFEFLGQENMSKNDGLELIHDFISQKEKIKDGLEPYPISLRIIFWIKFIIKHDIKDSKITHFLYQQLQLLSKKPEYHLMGNHLLENGFSLLFGAYFFNHKEIFQQAKKILLQELYEQILADGAHFELSPMYHQTILFRILDSINLLKNNTSQINDDDVLLQYLIKQAKKMSAWIKEITFKNGDIPLVNDSCTEIAPTTASLLKYAQRLQIEIQEISLSQCGYRKFQNDLFEIVIDVGNIGPDYIPGHAHSDTFNFVLYQNQQPLIIDTGISTYEKNKRRNIERSTTSHNTVMIDNKEQSQIWGGFRVAKRAKIIQLEESENEIKASHNGYKNINTTHERKFCFSKNQIIIHDIINHHHPCKAFFHFHPNIKFWKEENSIVWDKGKILFKQPSPNIDVKHSLRNDTLFSIEPYFLATGFNQTQKAQRISVHFSHYLLTEIYFHQ